MSSAAAMRYRDVAAASDWLCAAFGFHKHVVATSETGVVHYAQLTFGNAMFMLAPVRDTALEKYMKQPDEIGGAETQSCYLLVSDADAHYARAKASGAEIIVEIQDDDFGGRSYACRDPESHIWNFGTYDPWQGKRAGERHAQLAGRDARVTRRLAVVIGLLATIAASVVVAGGMYGALRPEQRTLEAIAKEAEERATQVAQERLNTEVRAREAAEHAARETKVQLDRERIARETAEHTAQQVERSTQIAQERLNTEVRAREAAEHAAWEAKEQSDRERIARETAERAAEQVAKRMEEERRATDAAESFARQAREELDRMRNAKEAAPEREQLDRERAAKETAERDVEQHRQRASEQQLAREAAERAANEAREQLSRERSAKNAALKAAAQLRRQLSQSAKQMVGEAYVDPDNPIAESKSAPPRPKQKQKTKASSPQE